jgi:hypothetical protein
MFLPWLAKIPFLQVKNLAASCEASSIPEEEEFYSRLLTPKQAPGNLQTVGLIRNFPVLVGRLLLDLPNSEFFQTGMSATVFVDDLGLNAAPSN